MKNKERIIFISITTICVLIWIFILLPLGEVKSIIQKGEVLKVIFFYVGQGDSSLIMTPGGKNILIDAGPPAEVIKFSEFDAAERVLIPFFKSQNINVLNLAIISHPHMDHYGGFVRLFEEMPVERVFDIAMPSSVPLYEKLITIIDEKE